MSLKHTPTSIKDLREQQGKDAAEKRRIAELEAANAELVGQITDLQIAIVDLYESASGAGGAENG
jgi:cell division protein FtsB